MARKRRSQKVPPESVPAFSDGALASRDAFFLHRNDVLIYCEDEGWDEFYLRLLERLNIGQHFEDVFCLGGKTELIKKLRGAATGGKRRVFILDKDFDDLHGSVRAEPEVAYFGRYSVENHFLSPRLFVDFVVDQKKRRSRREVEESLALDDVRIAISQWYEQACRYFVVAQSLRLGVANTKLPASEIMSTSGDLREEWFESFRRDFYSSVQDRHPHLAGEGGIEVLLANALDPAEGFEGVCDGTPECHHVGKHYLETYLAACHEKYGIGDDDEVRYRFLMSAVSRIEPAEFDLIAERVRRSIS